MLSGFNAAKSSSLVGLVPNVMSLVITVLGLDPGKFIGIGNCGELISVSGVLARGDPDDLVGYPEPATDLEGGRSRKGVLIWQLVDHIGNELVCVCAALRVVDGTTCTKVYLPHVVERARLLRLGVDLLGPGVDVVHAGQAMADAREACAADAQMVSLVEVGHSLEVEVLRAGASCKKKLF